jgi:type II restriction enzyme
MVNLAFYQKHLKINSEGELIRQFQKTIISTNRTAEFFVNWEKVKENAESMKIELSLMNSLIGSNDLEGDFKKLIADYPETLRTIPILIAVRDLEFPVIIDFLDIDKGVQNLDFNKTKHSKISNKEISDYLLFMKKSGLFILFDSIKNLYDYVLGVEVGMDTNARKNRSGDAMEQLLEPIIQQISNEIDCKVLSQKKFENMALYGRVPRSLTKRTADFILYKNNKMVNIEVNYYSGGGSKPEEIVPSYINRNNELKANGWEFIWITDGNAWIGSGNQLTNAFNELDYIMNINFTNKGLLKEALANILQ